MAIYNTEAYPKNFDQDIDKIFFDEMQAYPTVYQEIFSSEDAPKGKNYTESDLTGLGELEEIAQGGAVTFDVPEEGNEVTRSYTKYGRGFQATEENMDDDWRNTVGKLPKTLVRSSRDKIETVCATIFNGAFDTYTVKDGQYLCDTDHTILKTGQADYANEPSTAADLSETSLQEAFSYFDDTVIDETGFPAKMTPSILLVHPDEKYTAHNLLKALYKTGSMDNDINTLNPTYGIVPNIMPVTWRELTDTDAWFLIAKENDYRIFWKRRGKLLSADDFVTGNALFKFVMRFMAFVNQYSHTWGNPGAA